MVAPEACGRFEFVFAARLFVVLALAAAPLAASAEETSPKETKCREYPDGSSRCVGPDGHVRTERIGEDGRRRTTSTDPKLWGTSNGDGGGITPPPGLLDHRPDYRRAVYGRVTEPWTARKAEPSPQTAGVRVPRSNGCTVAGGEMRCRR